MILIGNDIIGTTLILIATDAFNKYQKATGGVPDSATSLLTITSNQYADLQSIFLSVNVNGVCVLPLIGHWQRGVISFSFSPGPGYIRINS